MTPPLSPTALGPIAASVLPLVRLVALGIATTPVNGNPTSASLQTAGTGVPRHRSALLQRHRIARLRTAPDARRKGLVLAAAVLLAVVLSAATMPAAAAAEEGDGAVPTHAAAARSAAALVALAQGEAAAGHLAAARDLYQQAVERDPASAEARAGLAAAEAVLAGRPGEAPAGQDTTQVRRELALIDARSAQDRADLLMHGGRHEDAATILGGARAALLPYREDAAVRAELERLDGLIAACWEQARAAAASGAAAGRAADRASAEQRRDAEQAYGRDIFRERLARIQALSRQGRFEAALAECRRLLRDHPGEAEAERLFASLLAAAHEQRKLSVQEQRAELMQEIRERITRSMIPAGFDGRPSYPEDWAERTRLPRTPLDAPTELPPWQARLLESLATRVSVAFDGVSAVDALNALAHQNGVNLIIDPALANGEAKPVSLRANHISLENVLSWICRQAGTGWTVAKGAIYVGGKEDLEPVLAVYDVADVVFQVKDAAAAPVLGIRGVAAGPANAGPLGPPAAAPDQPAIAPEDLVDHLQKAVSPETWAQPGYGITVRGTLLIVTAPPRVHLLVKQFISSMSHASKRLAQVVARWLRIEDGYLEEIGVEWTTGNLLRPIGATDPGYHRATSEFDHSGSLINHLPDVAVAPNPPTFGTGLTLNSTMIAATQLSAILTAVERNRQAVAVVEPSVVTVSGVRATCRVTHDLAYIADYNIGAGGGNGLSAAAGPQIGTLSLGGVLDVRPIVSSDGKYVTMDFASSLATLVEFTQSNIQTLRTFPTGFNAGANGGVGAPVTQTVVNTFTIETPNVLLDEIHTTVMVPDGGTLLVGGFANNGEQSTSTEIPFLGHLPYLGRLFGQRGRYSTRNKICLLVTVHVVDYPELERLQ